MQLQESADCARRCKVSRESEDIEESPESEHEEVRDEQSSAMGVPMPATGAEGRCLDSEEGSDSDTSDVDFDPDMVEEDAEEKMEEFCDTWIRSLGRDERVSLGLFLLFQMMLIFRFSIMKAAEYTSILIQRSEHTVCKWRKLFFLHGEVPRNKQGKYERSGVMWSSEDLNKAASYVRAQANIKGQPNMRISDFCTWVNTDLLPNSTLEPGFPRRIGLETARKWLHVLGFEFITPKKGSFVDGHEREDVVVYRKKFLRKMVGLGFLRPDNAPTEDAKNALPSDLHTPSIDRVEKTVIFFHDETIFHVNEDQSRQWGEKGTHVVQHKSKGRGIMVSDFVCEDGFLCLTEEELRAAGDNTLRATAREQIEYGENAEGYWTNERFMAQMEEAVKLAETKYPMAKGYRLVWIFDQSSCHAAKAENALDVSKMNVKPGGKQPAMRNTIWQGRVQQLTFNIGVPKGMKIILEERGINTRNMNADQMREKLGEMDDFKNEKSRIEHFLEDRGHICIFLPKYHPELNPIEWVWAQAKRHTKAYCKYTLPSLRKHIPLAFETIKPENIQNYYRKVRQYMFAYLEGLTGGPALEKEVKKYKEAVKSHRRISMNQ